jgi:hypothetical protein
MNEPIGEFCSVERKHRMTMAWIKTAATGNLETAAHARIRLKKKARVKMLSNLLLF